MNSRYFPSRQHCLIPALLVLGAEEFHDIAPPVDYSLIPPWLVFVIVFAALSLVGVILWLFAKRRKPPAPPKLPGDIALEELERISREIERMSPYLFSIRVSDILRKYVTRQHGLPATRQTSIEFLTALAKAASFSSLAKDAAFARAVRNSMEVCRVAGRPCCRVTYFRKISDTRMLNRYGLILSISRLIRSSSSSAISPGNFGGAGGLRRFANSHKITPTSESAAKTITKTNHGGINE